MRSSKGLFLELKSVMVLITWLALEMPGAHAMEATPTVINACEILVEGRTREVKAALIAQALARASERIERIQPGALRSLYRSGERLEIKVDGIPDASIFVEAKIAFLKSVKGSAEDYGPFFDAKTGDLPVTVIKEVRVWDYRDQNGAGRFRNQGFAKVMMSLASEVSRLSGIPRIAGRLDQDVRRLFCEDYETHHDLRHAVEACPSGRIFKNLGYHFDPENSPVAQAPIRDCMTASLWVTWTR